VGLVVVEFSRIKVPYFEAIRADTTACPAFFVRFLSRARGAGGAAGRARLRRVDWYPRGPCRTIPHGAGQVRTVCESLRILWARVFWRKAHVDVIAAPAASAAAGDASLHRGKVRAPSGQGGGACRRHITQCLCVPRRVLDRRDRHRTSWTTPHAHPGALWARCCDCAPSWVLVLWWRRRGSGSVGCEAIEFNAP
jgi:hypothetical protein